LPAGFDQNSQGITLGLSLVHEDVEGTGWRSAGSCRGSETSGRIPCRFNG
jgi:hypothetical protein